MRFLLLTLFGCLTFAAGRAQQPAKIEGAHLHMEVASHDFGDVPRKGGDLVREFTFTNDGTVPLVVTRVITSCSCLKASYSKRPVAPGESGTISITYEPHKSEPRLQQGDSDLLEFGGRPRRNHRAGQLDRSGTPQGQDRGGEDKV